MGSLKQFAALSAVAILINGAPALNVFRTSYERPSAVSKPLWIGPVCPSTGAETLYETARNTTHQLNQTSPAAQLNNKGKGEEASKSDDDDDTITLKRRMDGQWDPATRFCGAPGAEFSEARIIDVMPQLDYLRGLSGACHVGPATYPEEGVTHPTCSRISCEMHAGIYLCNYGRHEVHRSCRSLADFAEQLIFKCNKSYVPVHPMFKIYPNYPPAPGVLGQLGAKDGDYVVRVHDANC